jgi:hypothetical protein
VPDFFNAQGARLKNPPKIGSGSELKLSVRLVPYLAPNDGSVGISYQLEGVQILKLVSGGQRSASDYGFGAEDGDDIQDDNGGFADEGRRLQRRREHRPRLLMEHKFFLAVPRGGGQDPLHLPRQVPQVYTDPATGRGSMSRPRSQALPRNFPRWRSEGTSASTSRLSSTSPRPPRGCARRRQ